MLQRPVLEKLGGGGIIDRSIPLERLPAMDVEISKDLHTSRSPIIQRQYRAKGVVGRKAYCAVFTARSSQIRTVPSFEPVAYAEPSGAKSTQTTAA